MIYDEDIDVFLEHYGVKGQKWGVQNKDELVGESNNSKKKLSEKEIQSDQLQRKYGKDSMKDNPVPVKDHPRFPSLSPNQKKAALAVGGLALIGGGLYLANKYGLKDDAFDITKEGIFKAADLPMKNFSIGLDAHWEKGVHLPAGSIMQRLSTIKETDIRPKGFFAAFDKGDIERYKSELPKWWKQWGFPETEGYLVKLKASSAVKAPSGKETFEIFKNMMDNDNTLRHHFGEHVSKFTPEQRVKVVDGLAKSHFMSFAQNWANGYDGDPNVQKFFSIVKDKGYNALIDFNDSGHLAKTPMRILDGNNFKIDGHEHVNKAAIKLAQKAIKELVMAAMNSIENFLAHYGIKEEAKMFIDEKEVYVFLEHFGVKGQKWGKRRAKAASAAKTFGRGSLITAKAIGRGTKATAKWSMKNKKTAATIAVGVVAAGLILKGKHNTKIRDLKSKQRNFQASKKLLELNMNKKIHDLGGIAARASSGSVRRELSFQEMLGVERKHKDNLSVLAKKYGFDPKKVLSGV